MSKNKSNKVEAIERLSQLCSQHGISSKQATDGMANPNRTDYEGPPLSGPGILWINSRLTDPSFLPANSFHRWYEDIHIPDIIAAKPGGVVASWRYQCLDKTRDAPWLAVYKVPDMGFLQSSEFKAIPMVHDTLPEGGPIHKFAAFDARFLGFVESWKSKSAGNARTSLLISEAIEPADGSTDPFNEWYRGSYIDHVSKLPGWQRTSRFKLVFKKENKDESGKLKPITPTWLALHEFKSGSFDEGSIKGLLSQKSDAKEIEKTAKKIDVAAFEMMSRFGDKEAIWVDGDERAV